MDNISQAPPGLVLSPWSETQANQTPRAVPTENTINENSESLLESKQAEMAEGNIQPSIPTVCWENMSLSEKLLKKLEIIGAQLWAFSQPLIKRGVIEAAPALLLVAFSCGFSVAFLAVDDGPCGCGNGSNCTGGLWVSLYFTNTLHTSIGLSKLSKIKSDELMWN